MPEEFIKREEFNQSIGRIHDRVDVISKTTTQIETSAQSMQKSVEKMCDCVYGTTGKDGLIAKITRLFERSGLQTKLIIMIVVSILGLAFYVLQNFLIK